MWKKWVDAYRDFAKRKPGGRFVGTYQRWQEFTRHPVVSFVLILVAILLILGGLFLALVPGVPGIVLGALGFALIAARFRRVAVWLDWTEVHLRKLLNRFRGRHAHH